MASSRITNPQSSPPLAQLMAAGELPHWRTFVQPDPLPKEAEARLTQKKEALAFLAYQIKREEYTNSKTFVSSAEKHDASPFRELSNGAGFFVGPASLNQAVGFRDKVRDADHEPRWLDLRDFSQGFGGWGRLGVSVQSEDEAKADLKMIEAEERHIEVEAAKLEQRQKEVWQRQEELREMSLKRKEWEDPWLKAVEEKQRRLKETADRAMVGPAPAELAFSSRHDFKRQRSTPAGSDFETLSSRPMEESYLSYSYRMKRERLSLYESAPGSRWPQRLSAQRNCGFAGGVKRGLRKDAVNELDGQGREGRRRVIPVPQGLRDAMARKDQAPGKREDGEQIEEDEEEYYSAEEGGGLEDGYKLSYRALDLKIDRGWGAFGVDIPRKTTAADELEAMFEKGPGGQEWSNEEIVEQQKSVIARPGVVKRDIQAGWIDESSDSRYF